MRYFDEGGFVLPMADLGDTPDTPSTSNTDMSVILDIVKDNPTPGSLTTEGDASSFQAPDNLEALIQSFSGAFSSEGGDDLLPVLLAADKIAQVTNASYGLPQGWDQLGGLAKMAEAAVKSADEPVPSRGMIPTSQSKEDTENKFDEYNFKGIGPRTPLTENFGYRPGSVLFDRYNDFTGKQDNQNAVQKLLSGNFSDIGGAEWLKLMLPVLGGLASYKAATSGNKEVKEEQLGQNRWADSMNEYMQRRMKNIGMNPKTGLPWYRDTPIGANSYMPKV